jgi:hypothetical protein
MSMTEAPVAAPPSDFVTVPPMLNACGASSRGLSDLLQDDSTMQMVAAAIEMILPAENIVFVTMIMVHYKI